MDRLVESHPSPRDGVACVEEHAPENPDEEALRLRGESVLRIIVALAEFTAALFLIVVSGYCCFVILRYRIPSPEARAVLPLIVSLFGGGLGVVVGRGSSK